MQQVWGLKEDDKFGTDFIKAGKNKLYYDVIYEPCKTEFSEALKNEETLMKMV